MTTAERKIPAPLTLPDTQAYWDAANEGRLMIKRCDDCGEPHHYPRDVCPFCMSTRTSWLACSGKGTVYSYSTMRRGDLVYTLAYVTLDEGPTMMTNLVDCDPASLGVGQAVRAVFKPAENGQAVPMFTPAQ